MMKNAFAVSHSRIGRYEILYDFIVKTCKEDRTIYGNVDIGYVFEDNVKNVRIS